MSPQQKQAMSRTEQLMQQGHHERGGATEGGDAPFVHWGDEPSWVEGRMVSSFTTRYGLAIKLEVEGAHFGLMARTNGDKIAVLPGSLLAIGLQPASLDGKITEEHVGQRFHIAFQGWEISKAENRYRVFVVLDLDKYDDDDDFDLVQNDPEEETEGYEPEPTDDLPF